MNIIEKKNPPNTSKPKNSKLLVSSLFLLVSSFFTPPLSAAIQPDSLGIESDSSKPFESMDLLQHQDFEQLDADQLDQAKIEARNLAKSGVKLLDKGERGKGLELLQKAWDMDNSLASAGIAIGVNQLTAKEYDKTLATAVILQARYPKLTDGFNLAGMAYIGLSDHEKAINAFKKAQEVQPGDPSSSGSLAFYAQDKGDFKQALTLYENALQKNPGHLNLSLGLAKLHLRQGDYLAAKKLLEDLVAKYPRSLPAYVELLKTYLSMGDILKASEAIETGLIKFPEQASLIELKGIVKLRQGAYQEAKDLFSSVLTKSPESTLALYNMALTHEKLKDNEKALQTIDRALKIKPDRADFLFLRANLLKNAGKLDEALSTLSKLNAANPKNPEILGALGEIALLQNRLNDALSILNTSLSIQEINLNIVNLAITHFRMGKKELAYDTLTNWLKKQPSDIFTRRALADLLVQTGEFDKALAQYKEIIALNPDDQRAHNNVAAILARQGNLDNALEHAQLAIRISPTDANTLDTLGEIYLLRNQHDKAIESFSKALQTDPANPNIQFNLAQAFVKAEKKDNAKRILEKLATEVKFSKQEEAKKLLGTIK